MHIFRKHVFVQWQVWHKQIQGKDIKRLVFSLANFASKSPGQILQHISFSMAKVVGKIPGQGLQTPVFFKDDFVSKHREVNFFNGTKSIKIRGRNFKTQSYFGKSCEERSRARTSKREFCP